MPAVARKATPCPHELPSLRLIPAPPPMDAAMAIAVARRIAWRLVRQHAIRTSEIQDWIGDLLVEAVRKWPEFDAGRGRVEPYLRLVMERAAASLLRAHHALKRGNGRCKNLDDPTSLDSASLALDGPDPIDQHVLRLDVATVVSLLPPSHRRICALLSQLSVAATARALRMPRHRLLSELRDIRCRFAVAVMGTA